MSECVASRTRTENELTLFPPDLLRINNLKRHARFDDAVLMNTRTVCESVRTDNRFVRLNSNTHRPTHTPTNWDNLFRVNIGVVFFEIVTPGADRHDDLFK